LVPPARAHHTWCVWAASLQVTTHHQPWTPPPAASTPLGREREAGRTGRTTSRQKHQPCLFVARCAGAQDMRSQLNPALVYPMPCIPCSHTFLVTVCVSVLRPHAHHTGGGGVHRTRIQRAMRSLITGVCNEPDQTFAVVCGAVKAFLADPGSLCLHAAYPRPVHIVFEGRQG